MPQEEKTRLEQIHEKGFSMFNKIKVGTKTLEDAVLRIGSYKRIDPSYGDKYFVLDAIRRGEIETMRDISEFFFKTSGIYSRLCRYMAYLYRYDWLITPYINDNEPNTEKILKTFYKILTVFDNFGIKKNLGEIALKVMRRGCYYGYIIEGKDNFYIQELPVRYCRSKYSINDMPVVEFDMRFFDEQFRSVELRNRVLQLFPDEFKKGYKLYKQNKLKSDDLINYNSWFVLDPKFAFKFNLNDEDYPPFI